jgi:hypothetical protein
MTEKIEPKKPLWYIYEASTRPLANLQPDAYPVPTFCDPSTATKAEARNRYGEKVKVLAAKVDESKLDHLQEHERADYDEALATGQNKGDFVMNPFKLA